MSFKRESVLIFFSSGLIPRQLDRSNKGIDQEFHLFCSNIEHVQF